MVEEDTYLQELARYIHLNPLRAGLVRDLTVLDRYRWTGHSAVLGRVNRPWQAVDEILGHFGTKVGPARSQYRAFVAGGVRQGRRPELQGGGLKRSAGGWEGLRELRRGRANIHDEDGEFTLYGTFEVASPVEVTADFILSDILARRSHESTRIIRA